MGHVNKIPLKFTWKEVTSPKRKQAIIEHDIAYDEETNRGDTFEYEFNDCGIYELSVTSIAAQIEEFVSSTGREIHPYADRIVSKRGNIYVDPAINTSGIYPIPNDLTDFEELALSTLNRITLSDDLGVFPYLGGESVPFRNSDLNAGKARRDPEELYIATTPNAAIAAGFQISPPKL